LSGARYLREALDRFPAERAAQGVVALERVRVA
jgi:hypothetical protein